METEHIAKPAIRSIEDTNIPKRVGFFDIANCDVKESTRTLPFVFTEHGVLMLSSVLNSEQAVQVNIRSQDAQNKHIDLIFEYIDRLQEKLEAPAPPERKQIGYEIGREK